MCGLHISIHSLVAAVAQSGGWGCYQVRCQDPQHQVELSIDDTVRDCMELFVCTSEGLEVDASV